MNDNEKTKRLEYVLSNVNYWLSFSEAKNAANIAFTVALMSVIADQNNRFVCAVPFTIISGIISLVSFIPAFSRKKTSLKFSEGDINPLFYGAISNYDKDGYLQYIGRKYWNNCEFSPYQMDLSEEITTNSSIALQKYHLFK